MPPLDIADTQFEYIIVMTAYGEKATILSWQRNGRLPMLERTVVPEARMAAHDPKATKGIHRTTADHKTFTVQAKATNVASFTPQVVSKKPGCSTIFLAPPRK